MKMGWPSGDLEGAVHGRSTQPESGFTRGTWLEIGPGRGFEIEAFVAPTHGEQPGGGIFGYSIFEKHGSAPIDAFVPDGHDDIGMDAIGQDVNVDVTGGFCIGIYRDPRQAKLRSEIDQEETDDSAQGISDEFQIRRIINRFGTK